MFAVAIAMVALGFAIPSFQQVLLDARLTAAANALVADVQFARTETLKSGITAVLCQSNDHATCSGERDFTGGWIVYANHDNDTPPQRDPDEPLLRVHDQRPPGAVVSNRSAYEFRPYPKRSTNGTFTFCSDTARVHRLIVSYTGRPRVERVLVAGAAC
jgi:type IV fimbrial biogenesis protein FimT